MLGGYFRSQSTRGACLSPEQYKYNPSDEVLQHQGSVAVKCGHNIGISSRSGDGWLFLSKFSKLLFSTYLEN